MEIIADKKGEDILLLDIRGLSILADYFIIGSTESERQAKAIIEEIRLALKRQFGLLPLGVDGEAADGWVVLDYGNLIIHLFEPETRAYYDLEGLWQEGRVVVRML